MKVYFFCSVTGGELIMVVNSCNNTSTWI